MPNSVSLPASFPSSASLYAPHDDALGTLQLLAAELLLGLLFLHSLGVVHQDIKPANVLVSLDGHAVITDFGSARSMPVAGLAASACGPAYDESPEFSANAAWARAGGPAKTLFGPVVLRADDQVSYTRRYAAPELLEAPPGMEGQSVLVYDERVDYYSLGVVLRELAYGPKDAVDRWERASFDDAWGRDAAEADIEFSDFTEGVSAGLSITEAGRS